MADLQAELFGDFDSADEGTGARPSAAAAPLNEDDLADELFGDHQEGPKRKGEAPAAGEGERKPKRRKDLSKYYELEAEEAGGSGDEEEDGDLDGLIDDSAAPLGEKGRDKLRSQMQRQDRELDELRKDVEEREKGGESGASRVFGTSFLDRMEEKYKAMEEEEAAAGAAGAAAPPSPAISVGRKKETNAYVVPDPRDPKLWVVKTFGPEKGLCISLMRKSAEWFATGKPVPIFSVFYSEHLRGFIYVEAFKESDVRDFCRGITGISQWDIKIVPISQMPQVFMSSAVDADKHMLLKAGDWVRVKRGPYKGDLAQIDEVKDDIFVVKLKPRLRYGIEHQGKVDKADKASAKRPQPRWFNRADIEAGGLLVNTEKRFTPKGYLTFFVVDGESYRDGFLYKSFKTHWFDTAEQVRPLEHELQDWRFAPPVSENTRPEADLGKTDDKKLMLPPPVPKKVAQQRAALVEGDVVIVHSGDLKNLRGVVTKAIFGATTVLVKPLDVANLHGELNIAINLLSKYFQVGDYVKSIGGEHEGDTGYVLKVILDEKGGWGYNAMARVLSSSMSGEFNARVDNLRLTSQKPEPQDAVGEFAVGLLVRLEGRQNSRGLIVRLEASTRAIVLCTDGSKHDVGFGDLEPVSLPDKRIYKKSVWTMDRKGKKVMPGAIVKCPRGHGRTAPVKAEVLYIHNEFCFLKAVEGLTGERAYLVCPGNRCEFVFSMADQNKADSGGTKEDEKSAQKEQYGVVMASETTWLKPWVKKMMGIEEERGKAGSITTVGTAVRIHGGSYKGLRGEIRDHLQDKVRISLLCKPKLVVVNISDIAPDDYERPRHERFPSAGIAPTTPGLVGSAPGTPFTPASPTPADDDLPALEGAKEAAAGALTSESPTTAAAARMDGMAPDTAGAPAAVLAPSDTEEVSSAHAALKRRKPRLPSATGSAAKTGDASSRQVSQSPSALFGQPEHPRSRQGSTDGRAPWLATGVGVSYTRDSKPSTGWIVKVYADMAHVVSSLDQVGDDSGVHAVKGSETRPIECAKRGDMAYVFDGPRRGVKGKVVGLEKDSVYVRIEHADKGKHTLLFASAAGSDLVRVQKRAAAVCSREWEQAIEERRKQPPAQAQATAPAAQPKAAKPWWEITSEPSGAGAGAVEGTVTSMNLDTPQSPSSPAMAGATGPKRLAGAAAAPGVVGAAGAAEPAGADEPMLPAEETAAAPGSGADVSAPAGAAAPSAGDGDTGLLDSPRSPEVSPAAAAGDAQVGQPGGEAAAPTPPAAED